MATSNPANSATKAPSDPEEVKAPQEPNKSLRSKKRLNYDWLKWAKRLLEAAVTCGDHVGPEGGYYNRNTADTTTPTTAMVSQALFVLKVFGRKSRYFLHGVEVDALVRLVDLGHGESGTCAVRLKKLFELLLRHKSVDDDTYDAARAGLTQAALKSFDATQTSNFGVLDLCVCAHTVSNYVLATESPHVLVFGRLTDLLFMGSYDKDAKRLAQTQALASSFLEGNNLAKFVECLDKSTDKSTDSTRLWVVLSKLAHHALMASVRTFDDLPGLQARFSKNADVGTAYKLSRDFEELGLSANLVWVQVAKNAAHDFARHRGRAWLNNARTTLLLDALAKTADARSVMLELGSQATPVWVQVAWYAARDFNSKRGHEWLDNNNKTALLFEALSNAADARSTFLYMLND